MTRDATSERVKDSRAFLYFFIVVANCSGGGGYSLQEANGMCRWMTGVTIMEAQIFGC